MAHKWNYGDAWEQYPIEVGEIWGLPCNGSKVSVHNIFDPLPEFMLQADLLFVDPPWNRGNINSFYTKAGIEDRVEDFSDFERVFFQRVQDVAPPVCYIEIGFQAVDKWQTRLSEIYSHVQRWQVTYYKKNRCYILRGSRVGTIDQDFAGLDEADVIGMVGKIEKYNVMGDFCMGRGLVGMSAYHAGKPFVGTELNKRRLACLLQKVAKAGGKVERYVSDPG